MSRRQAQTYRRRRTTNQSSSGVGCIVFVFGAILLLVVLSAIISNLSSPSGQFFLGILVIGIVALLVIGAVAFIGWRYYRKQAQKQQMIAMQQQEYAQQQHLYAQQQWERQEWERQERVRYAREQWERQERVRLERERLERERIEREKQEQEKIARLKSLGDILVLTPREFEELTGKILEQNGLHDVRHIGGSGDLGVDLNGLDRNGNQVIVQCKRYATGSAIGSRDIQNFIGMMNVEHKAEKGIFVTTTKFTQPATDLAEKHNILLIDGDRLVKLVQAMQRNNQPH